eukprot:2357351-Rhodomonas_salina.1
MQQSWQKPTECAALGHRAPGVTGRRGHRAPPKAAHRAPGVTGRRGHRAPPKAAHSVGFCQLCYMRAVCERVQRVVPLRW